ncbi:glycosyltransferase family 4 protein [Pseudovibrio exalbescens]|uniref:Glycosyltransferase subfamily 4-like N-terminal domain-containing protein n=1 Tax=Pseudovibrio exalbescens TaxID=197461 RepID=A0A1U7JLU8_9HYPH|nr:glycosyltransferase family 4 protein [Pseudovibrio exalbescens]OKL45726.1 hypothetical protein A3843_01980 [Pseudovibrio exalbescens]
MAPIWQLVDSSGIGGIEKHILVLAQTLKAQGLDVRVVLLAPHDNNPWLDQLTMAGLPFTILEGGLKGLWRGLSAERPALVHSHGYKAGILGRLACRARGIPVVSTYHAGEAGPFPVSLYQTLDAYTGLLARRISVSRPIAARLPYASTVIENFINCPAMDTNRPLSRTVAFVGRLSHEKGPDLFCDFAAQQPRRPTLDWHLYGDGPMRPELEAKYGSLIEFHGMVSNLEPIWPTLGLIVLSSRAEGLPLVALEAMAHGVPVLAPRLGGLPDLIQHGVTGWLYDPEDLTDMSRAFRQWVQARPAFLTQMRTNCQQRIRSHYSPAAKLPLILDVYRNAGLRLTSSPTSPPTTGTASPPTGSSHLPVQGPARR